MDDEAPSQTQDDGQVETTTNVSVGEVDPRLIVQEEEPVAQVIAPAAEEPEAPEPIVEEPQPVSHRENKRISELTRKLQEANQRPNQVNQPQSNQIIGEGDYDMDQVNDLAQQYGEQRYAEGIKQASDNTMFMTRLEIDAPKVESKYEQLNPNSDKFDPGIADYTTQLFYKTVGMKAKADGTFTVENTNIRYSEFIDGMMDAVDALASSRQADSKVNLAKQAAQTGVRPNAVTKNVYQGDDPKKMTIEQLRTKVNQGLGIS